MTKKYQHCGPFKLEIDDQAQKTTIKLKRQGPKSWQLLKGELRLVAYWALSVAKKTGYQVDTSQVASFF